MKSFDFPKICFICGNRIDNIRDQICSKCVEESLKYNNINLITKHDRFDKIYCLYFYSKELKRTMYDIKVNLNTELLFPLASLLAKKITEDIDLITYVPAYAFNRITKGFNHSKILAEQISKIKKRPVIKTIKRKGIIQIREQKKLNKIDRFKKINREYTIIEKAEIRKKVILLVDDIMTTGATLNCCANLLMNNGVAKVYIGIIASGRRY